MEKILVAIDFSPSADRALAYAEEIALRHTAALELIHVQVEPDTGTASQRLTELAASVGARGITTTASVLQGSVVATLSDTINEGDCTLVVMGCQGENFLPNNPWGSTTTSLMESVRIPILAIPSHVPVKYPRRLLLATDATCPTRKRQLLLLLRFLEQERTELLLFHQLQATEAATPHTEYARLLQGVPHRFYYQADNQQATGDAVTDFANLTASDLIAVMHRTNDTNGTPGERSVAQRITWSSTTPVLILQDSF